MKPRSHFWCLLFALTAYTLNLTPGHAQQTTALVDVTAGPTQYQFVRPTTAQVVSANGLLTSAAAALAYQPLDSDLTSWSAITRASGFDTFTATPTGANLASLLTTALPASKGGTGLTALSANVVSLLGAADYSAMRTQLTLVPGTDVQAFEASLAALAGGSDFVTFTGPATSIKTFTLPNASATILTDNAAVTVAQGGTGRATGTTAYGLIAAGTTATGAQQTLAAGATTEVLVGGGASALPVWTTATGTGAPVRATSPTIVTPVISSITGVSSITGSGSTLAVTTAAASSPLRVDVYPSAANLAASTTYYNSSDLGNASYGRIGVLTGTNSRDFTIGVGKNGTGVTGNIVLQYDGTTALTISGSTGAATFAAGVTAASITNSGLTSGRVPYSNTAGLMTDSANFTFDGGSLTVGASASTFTITAARTTTTPSSAFLQAVASHPVLGFTSDTSGGYTWGRVLSNGTEVLRVHNANLTAISNTSGAGLAIGGGLLVASTTASTSTTTGSGIFGGGIGVAGAAYVGGAIVTTPQALSGAGAVNVTTTVTEFTSTGGAQALTLANGTVGQHKYIVHTVDGGSGVLTPTTKIGYSTITFTNVGDSVNLVYTTTGWAVAGSYGATIAP